MFIPDPQIRDVDFFPVPDPGGQKSTGSPAGSATLILNHCLQGESPGCGGRDEVKAEDQDWGPALYYRGGGGGAQQAEAAARPPLQNSEGASSAAHLWNPQAWRHSDKFLKDDDDKIWE